MIFLVLYTMDNKLIKVILAKEQVFPQTVAEAVLIKNGQVTTLDKILPRKIEQIITSEDSGLVSSREGVSIMINHANKITPNDIPKSRLIQYDQNGHIIKVEPTKTQTVLVNNTVYSQYDGNTDSNIKFGDDFKVIDNKISLTWGGREIKLKN